MRRREFIKLIGGVTIAWPIAAGAQEPGRIYRLGDLHLSPRNAPWNVALFDAVKPDGFIDGQNLLVDDQGFGLHVAQLSEHASAVVKAKVDVIICGGDPPVRAAQQVTTEIPILGIAEDMVGSRWQSPTSLPAQSKRQRTLARRHLTCWRRRCSTTIVRSS
jgi:putative ABC transport system substrate-binding protein